MSRAMLVCLLAIGCASEDPPECETQGIQTCSSQLEISFADNRMGPFELNVDDENGMDLRILCPDETKGPDEQDGYSWICTGSGVLITTDTTFFSDEVRIAVGQALAEVYPVDNTSGQDKCANSCTIGSVEI